MPSKLLAECIDQLEHHGIGSPEFRDYFLSKKSRLLSNIDIACDLVVLAVQDDDPSGNAVQLLSLLLDEARMGLENDSAYAEDFLETVEMAVQAGLAAGAVKQRNLMELAGLYRQVGWDQFSRKVTYVIYLLIKEGFVDGGGGQFQHQSRPWRTETGNTPKGSRRLAGNWNDCAVPCHATLYVIEQI